MPYKDPVKRQNYKKAWYVKNRAKSLMRVSRWRKENMDRRRLGARRRAGIINPTGEQPNKPCEICGKYLKLVMDHNHDTGLRRGWLCKRCNLAIGWVEITQQDPRFSEYLSKYN